MDHRAYYRRDDHWVFHLYGDEGMKKVNYRHFVCIAITLGFAVCGVFFFLNSFGRIIEAGRDFGLSVAYYFCSLFRLPITFRVTVNDFAKIPFFDFLPGKMSSTFLPETWSGFRAKWGAYWSLWANKDNFLSYCAGFGTIAKVFVISVIPVLVLLIVLRVFFRVYLSKHNNDYAHESRPLRAYKHFVAKVCMPVRDWIKGFLGFVAMHKGYRIAWLLMWAFYFNAFTILLEFFAWYLYFVISFDLVNLYRHLCLTSLEHL